MPHLHDLDAHQNTASLLSAHRGENGSPLELTPPEKQALIDISLKCTRLLSIRSLASYHQVESLNAALLGMEAVLADEPNALAQACLMGLKAIDQIQAVSPFIFHNQDGANRNRVPIERTQLKDLALRLHLLKRSSNKSIADRALCLRALACAAISAERGLIHIAKENFGAALRILHNEQNSFSGAVTWTDELASYVIRHAASSVRLP